METIKVKRGEFIEWRWNNSDEMKELSNLLYEGFEESDNPTFDLKSHVANSGYLPKSVIVNWDELAKEMSKENNCKVEDLDEEIEGPFSPEEIEIVR